MEPGKKDKRVVRTERAIDEAVRELLKEGVGPRFTVTAIAKRANINRKTFYAHYKTADDALQAVVDDEVRKMYRKMAESTEETEERDVYGITLRLLRLFDSSKLLNTGLLEGEDLIRMLGMVRNSTRKIIEECETFCKKREQGPAGVHLAMYLNCVFASYFEWRDAKPSMSLDELARIVSSFTLNGMAKC